MTRALSLTLTSVAACIIFSLDSGLAQPATDLVGTWQLVSNVETTADGKKTDKLGDSVWLAEGPNLEIGTPVIVTGMRGTVVLVSKL